MPAPNNIVNIENKWVNENDVFALTDRLADIDIHIDQLNEEINNNKANRAEVNDMRTNFTQRLGSILVDKLFIKTKWVNDRIKPTDEEVDEFVNEFSSKTKAIIDNAEPIEEGSKSFINWKRKYGDENQYAEYPIHKRLVYIFFDELQNTTFFNSNKDEINERTSLQSEKRSVNNRIAELKKERKAA